MEFFPFYSGECSVGARWQSWAPGFKLYLGDVGALFILCSA
jgi:hypothetical protein